MVLTILSLAWRVDFNLTLPSFEPLLAGLRNLLELSRQAKQNGREPRFAFISSISVFRGTSHYEEVITKCTDAKDFGGLLRFGSCTRSSH